VLGPAGAGKTTLVRLFLNDRFGSVFGHPLFPGGVAYVYGYYAEPIRDYVNREIGLPIYQRALLVIDEAEQLSEPQRFEVGALLSQFPSLSLLLSSREEVRIGDQTPLIITLGALDFEQFLELLHQEISDIDHSVARDLWAAVKGNPLMATISAQTIREGGVQWRQVLRSFDRFGRTGVLDPDGRPVDLDRKPPCQIVAQVCATNDELIRMLRANPDALHSLAPRRFEEIVGELLSRQGYRVELTPTSRDGGFDIYVAKKDDIGEFLYLVECKRYTPPRKVGVQVIRSLYGVVQQRNATGGIVVTTSYFTSDAIDFQQSLRYQLHLRDYIELQRWLHII
jgi:restriction system protein